MHQTGWHALANPDLTLTIAKPLQTLADRYDRSRGLCGICVAMVALKVLSIVGEAPPPMSHTQKSTASESQSKQYGV